MAFGDIDQWETNVAFTVNFVGVNRVMITDLVISLYRNAYNRN
jgi:hypothetical protein